MINHNDPDRGKALADSGRYLAGSAGSPGSAGSGERPTRTVLDEVCDHFERYIGVMHDGDLDILTLWTAHTHLASECYTSPRLLIDSPVPGSGKTTTLEHMQRLCAAPLQAASLSSAALLARILAKQIRTLLIDEADRNLDPKRPGVDDLLAVINAGYKRGATRPVLVPVKGGGWDADEMPTFSPAALAGNSPQLPADTLSRTIRVLLLPDLEDKVAITDWELIEDHVLALGEHLAKWAVAVKGTVATARPELPAGCTGRTRERWSPLRRVAAAAGGRWPDACDQLILRDIAEAEAAREDGAERIPVHITLLRDIREVWGTAHFTSTTELLVKLETHHPEMWGPLSTYGKSITAQRMGRMLVKSFKINSTRTADKIRGYQVSSFVPVWSRLGIPLPSEPARPVEPAEPAEGRAS
jgi:hypothetical protein